MELGELETTSSRLKGRLDRCFAVLGSIKNTHASLLLLKLVGRIARREAGFLLT